MSSAVESLGGLPDNALRWLEAVQRRLAREVEPLLSDDVRAVGLRRIRILELIPPSGIRQTDLATRALVTKQALGPVVDAMEQDGLVHRVVDETDARAWIVTLSTDGARVVRVFDAAVDRVLQGLAAEVGPDDGATFLRVLRTYGSGEIERSSK